MTLSNTEIPQLDDLFDTLKSEITSLQDQKHVQLTADKEHEFEKIRESIKKLPKLASSLDTAKVQPPKDTSSRNIIYDPIQVKKAAEKEPKDAGKSWFNMPKPEVTKEMKNDLLVISKRDVLDPKRHYKKQKWVQPQFFQIGEIVHDHYLKNLSRKQKGTSLVNELLANEDTKKYFKRKYSEIQAVKTSGKKGDYKKRQKLRSKY